jgi:hypothetical protein
VGINLGGFTGLPRRVLIANNTVLSGDERRGRHHTSIRLKPAYRSMAAANRPVIANNILHVARRPSLCAGARVVKSNVIMDGVACSAGDVVGDPLLDRRGRPTAESALVIDRASRTWAPDAAEPRWAARHRVLGRARILRIRTLPASLRRIRPSHPGSVSSF